MSTLLTLADASPLLTESAPPLYLVYPLLSAAIYALASIFIKRAITDGARIRHVFHMTNLAVGMVTFPLIFLGASSIDWSLIYLPIIMGICFFLAAWFTVAAMRHGDVSLVTPVMGTKVVFVALGSVLVFGNSLPLILVLAAILTAVGIFILGIPDIMRRTGKLGSAVGFALLSAGLFAICDLLVQTFAPAFGRMAFIGLSSFFVALFSVAMLIRNHHQDDGIPTFPHGTCARWLWIGAILTGIQALILGLALATFNDATGINVVYSSRGMWAILLVWLVGPLLGNLERHGMGRSYLWRVLGSLLLTAAIVMAVLARS